VSTKHIQFILSEDVLESFNETGSESKYICDFSGSKYVGTAANN
jgi:hypothetical protein